VKKLLAVALGGTAGSLVRYLLSNRGDEITLFLVNIAGVFVAGLIAYRWKTSEIMKIALIPGFAGGLTTFSSVAVIHAESNSLKAITYFYLMTAVSITVLHIVKPKAAQ
jgi:fluoride ion exporter CrcB/FEX